MDEGGGAGMTRRTVLLIIGLLCWPSAEAIAQTVDTSATGTLVEEASSTTEPVTTAASQELEPVTKLVSSPDSTTPSATGSAQPDSSSGDANAPEECETRPTKNGGSEEGEAVGGRASGDDPTSNGGLSASRADLRDRLLAARREKARGEGVLGESAEGGTPLPAPIPNPPSEFPFWGGLAVLIVLGLGFAGFMAALTHHLLGRTRSS